MYPLTAFSTESKRPVIANTTGEMGEWHSGDMTDKSRRITSLYKIITDYLQ
jgi:hypothetical protein